MHSKTSPPEPGPRDPGNRQDFLPSNPPQLLPDPAFGAPDAGGSSLGERLYRSAVMAVLVIDRVEDAVPLARALIDGGIDCMELTLRTPAALEALAAIRREAPQMLAGVGTILTPAQVEQAQEAGAEYGLAPGLNPRVVQAAQARGLPFAPGVATPSELESALELGCRLLKFFPAEPCGGLPFLDAMAGPYAHLDCRFVPLGGITAEQIKTYLQHPLIWMICGSWIAPRRLIQEQNWKAITTRAAEAHRLALEIRNSHHAQ